MAHPVLSWFLDVVAGRHPPDDGGVTFVPAFDDGREAVVAFTGHAVIATRLGPDDLADLAPDGFGAALAPSVLLRLAGGGTIGVNDVTLYALGTGAAAGSSAALRPTSRWDDHPRAEHARLLRRDVEVYGDERGFVTLGTGLGGRPELSIELVRARRARGLGRELLHDALTLVPENVAVFAAVSPGNARSLRSFLAAGFTPIASEVIITPRSPSPR